MWNLSANLGFWRQAAYKNINIYNRRIWPEEKKLKSSFVHFMNYFYVNKNTVSETETKCRTQGKMVTVYKTFVLKSDYGDMYTWNNDSETGI